MNDTQVSHDALANTSRDELTSALFASMVMQQTNLALMLLGKTPHPETGQTLRDLDGAKMFIDQLEMLEAKTQGNLSKEEAAMLKQNLMALRLSFVEAVEFSPLQSEAQPLKEARAAEAAQKAEAAPGPAIEAEEEHRKKFTKKY